MTGARAADRLAYALVTPAWNEGAFIERTLRSVVSQTRTPDRWIIVSDGSTDETHAVVQGYARAHPWIELLPIGPQDGSPLARKARAFNTGCARLRSEAYDLIGNLDADISFDREFFEYLVGKFAELPDLGIAGGAMIEDSVSAYDFRFTGTQHVSGGCQLFRRACLDAIGGYVVADGGIDTMAVTSARMRGWQTRTFVEKAWIHHRRMDSARHSPARIWFQRGRKDYLLGNSASWQAVRSLYQMTRPPVLVRGTLMSAGYLTGALRGRPRLVSREMQQFRRAEQTRRIRLAAARLVSRRTRAAGSEHVADLSLGESLFRLGAWVEAHNYRGYEPFDGLSSYLRPLTLGLQFPERVLQQLVRRSPLNLRPLLGITPLESTKGRGYMARGYLARWRHTGADEYRANAVRCLDWLVEHRSPHYRDFSWGNHFDFTSRAGRHRKDESILVWTSLIGQAFLDAYENLSDEPFLDVARSVCDWILKLPREVTPAGTCLSYLAGRQLSIHNANLLGAAMLARTAKHTRSAELVDVAGAAVRYSCSAQRADGSWYYAEPSTYHWIDSFHTGYNLDSIRCYGDSTGDTTFDTHLERGYRYFRAHFIEADGTPRYYHDRTYPIDIQCAAQAIETLANASDRDPSALTEAMRVARWTIRHLQDPAGYFYYRKSPRFTTKTPMLHWGQATMYRALALVSLVSSRHGRGVAGARGSECA
jgi:hypothetical protein